MRLYKLDNFKKWPLTKKIRTTKKTKKNTPTRAYSTSLLWFMPAEQTNECLILWRDVSKKRVSSQFHHAPAGE